MLTMVAAPAAEDWTLIRGHVELCLGEHRRNCRAIFALEFASKAVKEVAYHRELSAEWVIRLGDGTDESARRMAEGLDWNWRFVPELFEVDESLQALIDRGVAPDPRRTAGPPQRASRAFARRDAVPAAHLSRREVVG